MTDSSKKKNHNYQKETDAENTDGDNDNSQTDNNNTGKEQNTETNTNTDINTNDDKGMNGSDNGNSGEDKNTNTNTNRNDKTNGKDDGDESGSDNENGTTATIPSLGHDITVMQTFTVQFNIRSIPANKIGFIHEELIKEILTVAPFTTFEASNKQTTPAPSKITKIEQFLSNHQLHQKFFHRLDIREKVKYTHHVYSPVSVIDIKRRALPFLQEHNIGME